MTSKIDPQTWRRMRARFKGIDFRMFHAGRYLLDRTFKRTKRDGTEFMIRDDTGLNPFDENLVRSAIWALKRGNLTEAKSIRLYLVLEKYRGQIQFDLLTGRRC